MSNNHVKLTKEEVIGYMSSTVTDLLQKLNTDSKTSRQALSKIKSDLSDIFKKLEGLVKDKTKAHKDENQPKKPMSPYIYFSVDCRKDVKAKHPNMSAVEVTKEIAKRWNEMSEKEKAPYVKKAADDKKRYENEKGGSSSDNHSDHSDEEKHSEPSSDHSDEEKEEAPKPEKKKRASSKKAEK